MRIEKARRTLSAERINVLLGTIGGLLFAVGVGLLAVGYSGNPVKTLMLAVGAVLLVIGTLKPITGLYILVLSSMCLDFFKRFLVLFGIGSMSDVIGALAAAPMILVGTFLGACVLRPIFTKKMLEKDERRLVYGALTLIGIALAAGYRQVYSPGEWLGSAANRSAYSLLLPTVFVLYRGKEIDSIKRLLRFAAFAYLPVAVYGVCQFWFGYNQLEIDYLRSGLTITVSNLYDIHPRPFSTLNSPHAFSTLMWFMVVISGYLAFRRSPLRVCPVWVPVVFVVGLAFSLVRGVIFLAVANIAMGRWFKTVKGTLFFYAITLGILVAIVAFSQTLLDSIEYLESALPFDQNWQKQAFRLGTISDRLLGYQGVLLNPRMYTLFGHGISSLELDLTYDQEGYSHDSLSQLLFRFGVVGVAAFASVAIFILWRIHSAVWRTRDPERKTFAALLVSIVVLILLSHIGGASFNVFPINLFIWLFFGMAWTVCFGMHSSPPDGPDRPKEQPDPVPTRSFRQRRGEHGTIPASDLPWVSRPRAHL